MLPPASVVMSLPIPRSALRLEKACFVKVLPKSDDTANCRTLASCHVT